VVDKVHSRSTATGPPTRTKRWLQFSLSRLFATITLVAISTGTMRVASQLADQMFPVFLPALALGLGSVACGITSASVLIKGEKQVAMATSAVAALAFVGYVVSEWSITFVPSW
jgi:hypothetical protein